VQIPIRLKRRNLIQN